MISAIKSLLSKISPPATHYTYEDMRSYLRQRQVGEHLLDFKVMKRHWDTCRDCWSLWNKARWDEASTKRGMKELKEYLGYGFVDYFDSSWALVSEWESKKPETGDEVAAFYKHTSSYLYNLTIWYESGERYDFTSYFDHFAKKYNIKSYIDYGCGIGNDGLYLLETGQQVTFIDFDCPSTDFLKWRLKKRKLHASVLDVEKVKKFPSADALIAIDVLEHMVNPLEVVEKLSDQTRLFVHLSQFNNRANGRHPFHFSFDEIRLNNLLKSRGFVQIPDKLLSIWVKK